MAAEMIERVAIAIWDKMVFGDSSSQHWDTQDLTIREHYRGVAHAAIAAMREPTVEMIDAASGKSILRDWQAMIDASLKELLCEHLFVITAKVSFEPKQHKSKKKMKL